MYIIVNIRTATPETTNGHSLRIFESNREAELYIADEELDPNRYSIYELTERPHLI